MQLDELQLDRYLYRSNNSPSADSSLFSPNEGGDGSGGGSSIASGIASGSVISSSILQSSPSDNRIEINPDDTLRAYNNGLVVLQIDKNGLTLAGNQYFTFEGTRQPVIYTGRVSAAGFILNAPPGWTASFSFLGFYTITHNLGVAPPGLRVFAMTNGNNGIANVGTSGANSFQISFQDDAGIQLPTDFTFLALRYLP